MISPSPQTHYHWAHMSRFRKRNFGKSIWVLICSCNKRNSLFTRIFPLCISNSSSSPKSDTCYISYGNFNGMLSASQTHRDVGQHGKIPWKKNKSVELLRYYWLLHMYSHSAQNSVLCLHVQRRFSYIWICDSIIWSPHFALSWIYVLVIFYS